jgi:integrase/NADH:ubiquinone oxidoreductase subunit
MARPATGTVIRKSTKLGITYALKVRYKGRREYVYLGGSWEGWTEERVDEERRYIAQQVTRGEWIPPSQQTSSGRSAPAEPSGNLTFQVYASTCLARWSRRIADSTREGLEWRLSVAIAHIGQLPLAGVDEQALEGMVQALLLEREAIEQANADGHPLMEEVTDKRGRTYRRRRRGLSNTSINEVLGVVRRVLEHARRRGVIDRDPADDPDLRVSTRRPSRSFLEAHELEAFFDAARRVEAENRGLDWDKVRYIRSSAASNRALAREFGVSDVLISKVRRRLVWDVEPDARGRNEIPRLAVCATLALTGLRNLELCSLDGEHMDFAAGRIRVPRVKSDASERVVPMVPALRDVLLEHRAEHPYELGDPVFPTSNGTRNTTHNIRRHVIDPVRARANELLLEAGRPEIRRLTPHTLRRTFASILAECNVPPRRAMYLLGHTDPTLTMAVYQQVLDLGGAGIKTLERLLGARLDDVGRVLCGRQPEAEWSPIGHSALNALDRTTSATRQEEPNDAD